MATKLFLEKGQYGYKKIQTFMLMPELKEISLNLEKCFPTKNFKVP
jgi:hypothetical protein